MSLFIKRRETEDKIFTGKIGWCVNYILPRLMKPKKELDKSLFLSIYPKLQSGNCIQNVIFKELHIPIAESYKRKSDYETTDNRWLAVEMLDKIGKNIQNHTLSFCVFFFHSKFPNTQTLFAGRSNTR